MNVYWSELMREDVCEIQLPGYFGRVYFLVFATLSILKEQSELNSRHPRWPWFLPYGLIKWIVPLVVIYPVLACLLALAERPEPLMLVILAAVPAIPFLLVWWLIRIATNRGLVVANNKALRKKIEELVGEAHLKTPLFTTHSEKTEFWHPLLFKDGPIGHHHDHD